MVQNVKVASLQLDNSPAILEDRLERAAIQIAAAREAGAQFVVMPEFFNTGYAYTDENYQRAEPLDGPTIRWMKEQAAKHDIYLAGALLLLDIEDIYSSLILVAPHGRLWRYDRNFPLGCDHAYFRSGERIVIAHTALGRLGLLAGADVLYPEMWSRYAGRVDAIVACAVIPQTLEHAYMGTFSAQCGWLEVPAVFATAYGTLSSSGSAPCPLACYPFRPQMWQRRAALDQDKLKVRLGGRSEVVDARGAVISQCMTKADAFCLADLSFPSSGYVPTSTQPRPKALFLLRLRSSLAAAVAIRHYQRSLRRVWGETMAPVAHSTRQWRTVLILASLTAAILGVNIGLDIGRFLELRRQAQREREAK